MIYKDEYIRFTNRITLNVVVFPAQRRRKHINPEGSYAVTACLKNPRGGNYTLEKEKEERKGKKKKKKGEGADHLETNKNKNPVFRVFL